MKEKWIISQGEFNNTIQQLSICSLANAGNYLVGSLFYEP